MDPETRTAIDEMRETVAGLRQSLRLLDTAIEDLTRDLDQRLRQLETRGRGDNGTSALRAGASVTTSIPPGCTVVWDGPHSYLVPDLAAIAALEDPAAAQRAAVQDARERLQDLISYTSRARTAGSAEAARLQREPAQVLAAVENYATNVLDLLNYAAPAD
jgi:hypothetical protein